MEWVVVACLACIPISCAYGFALMEYPSVMRWHEDAIEKNVHSISDCRRRLRELHREGSTARAEMISAKKRFYDRMAELRGTF